MVLYTKLLAPSALTHDVDYEAWKTRVNEYITLSYKVAFYMDQTRLKFSFDAFRRAEIFGGKIKN